MICNDIGKNPPGMCGVLVNSVQPAFQLIVWLVLGSICIVFGVTV